MKEQKTVKVEKSTSERVSELVNSFPEWAKEKLKEDFEETQTFEAAAKVEIYSVKINGKIVVNAIITGNGNVLQESLLNALKEVMQ